MLCRAPDARVRTSTSATSSRRTRRRHHRARSPLDPSSKCCRPTHSSRQPTEHQLSRSQVREQSTPRHYRAPPSQQRQMPSRRHHTVIAQTRSCVACHHSRSLRLTRVQPQADRLYRRCRLRASPLRSTARDDSFRRHPSSSPARSTTAIRGAILTTSRTPLAQPRRRTRETRRAPTPSLRCKPRRHRMHSSTRHPRAIARIRLLRHFQSQQQQP